MNKINYLKGLQEVRKHSSLKPALYENINPYLKLFDKICNGELSKLEFINKINTMKDNINSQNIDSHDNSLYHESLYKKKNNFTFKSYNKENKEK